MAVVLEGGCRVSTMHEGEPHVSGSLRVWQQIGKSSGADAISLRVLEFGPGLSPTLRNREADEVLYLLQDLHDALNDDSSSLSCTVLIDGSAYEIGAQTGVY